MTHSVSWMNVLYQNSTPSKPCTYGGLISHPRQHSLSSELQSPVAVWPTHNVRMTSLHYFGLFVKRSFGQITLKKYLEAVHCPTMGLCIQHTQQLVFETLSWSAVSSEASSEVPSHHRINLGVTWIIRGTHYLRKYGYECIRHSVIWY